MRGIYIVLCLSLVVAIVVVLLAPSEKKVTTVVARQQITTTPKVAPEPKEAPCPQSKQTIVLDPGHGMANIVKGLWDPGITVGKTYEATVVLKQAKTVKKLLEKLGYKVYLTRSNQKTPCELKKRIPTARAYKPTILVSLHCNGYSSSKVHGQEVIYWNEKSELLAEMVLEELVTHLKKSHIKVRNRGMLKKKFKMVRFELTSIIVEAGFLSNPSDRSFLTSDKQAAAQGIVNGIDKYLTLLRGKKTLKTAPKHL